MPTVLIIGPYRFFFYSGDRGELPHIHVEREQKVAKFWIIPVMLENSGQFTRKELSDLFKLVVENQELFNKKWNEYFNY
jgi:hypothetical protein